MLTKGRSKLTFSYQLVQKKFLTKLNTFYNRNILQTIVGNNLNVIKTIYAYMKILQVPSYFMGKE